MSFMTKPVGDALLFSQYLIGATSELYSTWEGTTQGR